MIDATAEVAAAAAEWARTVDLPLGSESRLRVELPSQPLGVSFDPEHLRRVLVNLLDNARRHASESPGAIFLRLGSKCYQQEARKGEKNFFHGMLKSYDCFENHIQDAIFLKRFLMLG